MTPLPETLDRLERRAKAAESRRIKVSCDPATVLRLVAVARAAVEAEDALRTLAARYRGLLIEHYRTGASGPTEFEAEREADEYLNTTDNGYGAALMSVANLRRARGTP